LGVETTSSKRALMVLAILLSQASGLATIVEDSRYRFRVDLPGIVSARVEESDAKSGPLIWRAYSSRSPDGQRNSYIAAVKVFDTDSSDARVLFEAGESDASQAIGTSLIGRRDGTVGVAKLLSRTLSFQSGRDGAADMQRATVLLVVKGRRLYELTFSYSGPTDQSAIAKTFFASFEVLK
jgi:hypothetical protein